MEKSKLLIFRYDLIFENEAFRNKEVVILASP